MNLNLDRPLAFFDIESTGINTQVDRIIDLAVITFHPDGSCAEKVFRVNPGRPIPPGATAIHGITDADVADAPSFAEVAADVARCLDGCDLAGFNVLHYDIPLLEAEFQRAGVPFDASTRRVVDAQRIFHKREPRDLSAALRFYCGADHTGAHAALDDTRATIRVLEGQLDRYRDLPRDVESLFQYCAPVQPDWADRTGRLRWDDEGEMVLHFGPHQGLRLRQVATEHPSFLQWMLRKDFSMEIKKIVKEALEGIFPSRYAGNG